MVLGCGNINGYFVVNSKKKKFTHISTVKYDEIKPT